LKQLLEIQNLEMLDENEIEKQPEGIPKNQEPEES